jgi:ABC-type sugar transport system ATPase subunit
MDTNTLVELREVGKSYGPIRALDGISFTIRRGEVHALLGENGAGKSTTMRVIKGETEPDVGAVLVDGQTIERFSPAAASALGIAMVHQELAVFDDLTVAENILPSMRERTSLGFIDRKAMFRRAADSLRLFGLDIDPASIMRDLRVGQQQIVEILRAISGDRRLIILDEPTSSLNAQETAVLLNLIKRLRAEGKSVLFVSHRIPEVLEISDRITVLRDGRYIETLENQGLSEADLISRMVGRELTGLYARRTYSMLDEAEPVFEANGISCEGGIGAVDVTVHRGEIVGIFGLEGSGTHELAKVLFGMREASAGELHVNGRAVKNPSPGRLIAEGVTYMSPDRKRSGLFMSRSIADNISAPILRQLSSRGFIDRKRGEGIAARFMSLFSIKAPSSASLPGALSGGNQQKVMMAACLSPDPEVLIVNEPTRGVDVGAKVEMHRKLIDFAAEGKGLIVFSSELPELLSLCDRLVVLRNNGVAGVLTGAEISEVAAMALAAGGTLH